MKILFVTQHETPNREDGRIFGGTQMCETQRINLLSKNSELTVYTPKDSYPYKGCSTVNSSINSYRGGDQKGSNIRNSELLTLIENNKYDAVLINDFTNSTHSKLTNSSAKAVLIFHHVTPKNLGGISSFSKLETVYKNYKKGGITILPSISCSEQWKHYTKNSIEKYPKYFSNVKDYQENIDNILSFFIYPFISYEDFPIQENNDGEAILVARVSEDKLVTRAFDLAKNNNYDLKLFCPEIETEYQIKIAELYEKTFNRKPIINAPREKILYEISKSKFVINSVFDESFHIVSAEAAMCGVPVVSFGSKHFSPASIEANGMKESVIVNSCKDKFVVQNIDLNNKKIIQEKTKERYNEENCLDKILSYINVSNSLRKNTVTLEEFF